MAGQYAGQIVSGFQGTFLSEANLLVTAKHFMGDGGTDKGDDQGVTMEVLKVKLNRSDAFVAAWLPGTEGKGVADVLFRDASGNLNKDFTGKLSFP